MLKILTDIIEIDNSSAKKFQAIKAPYISNALELQARARLLQNQLSPTPAFETLKQYDIGRVVLQYFLFSAIFLYVLMLGVMKCKKIRFINKRY